MPEKTSLERWEERMKAKRRAEAREDLAEANRLAQQYQNRRNRDGMETGISENSLPPAPMRQK